MIFLSLWATSTLAQPSPALLKTQTIILESLSLSSSSITTSAVGYGRWACRCYTSYEQGLERKKTICEDISFFNYCFSINVVIAYIVKCLAFTALLCFCTYSAVWHVLVLVTFVFHQLEDFLCSAVNSVLACSICPPLCLTLDFPVYSVAFVFLSFSPSSPLNVRCLHWLVFF